MSTLKDRLAEGPSPKLLNGTCEFDLCNETPADWNVTIIEAGAKFLDSDGSDYTDGPVPLNLPTGTCHAFASADSSKCVRQVFVALNVAVPGEAPQTLTYQTEMAPDGQCWTRQGVVLGQADTINEREMNANSRISRLRLRSR